MTFSLASYEEKKETPLFMNFLRLEVQSNVIISLIRKLIKGVFTFEGITVDTTGN